MGRYDFFRILLPGAIVAALLYGVAQIALATSQMPWEEVQRLARFVEAPLPALVVAFGIGLVLYLIDPAYSSPEYFDGIPSEHLRKRLAERGIDRVDVLSLFFLAADECMSGALQERTLLYGALFRTGFQLTVYTLAAGAVSPWIIVLHPGFNILKVTPFDMSAVGWALLSLGAIAVLYSLQLIRGATDRANVWRLMISSLREAGAQLRSQPEAAVVPVVATGAAVGAMVVMMRVDERRWALAVHGSVLLVWLVLRFLGPVQPRVDKLFRGVSGRPASPFQPTCRLTLDLAPIGVGLVGMLIVSGVASTAQLIAIGCLLVVGFALSFTRKVERQQSGIYRNQNAWLDLHIDELAEEAEKLAAAQGGT